VARAVELAAVLPGNTHIVACLLDFVDGLAVLFTPLGAVQEQHVGALRLGYLHAVKMLCDVAAGEVPEQYYCQCQHYMAVMGYEYMYLAILVYTKGFYWFRVERNQLFIEDMINEEVYFWTQYIEKNQPPAPDSSESAADTLTKMHPQDNGLEIWLSSDSDIERYQEVSKTIKNLEKTKEELRTRICAELGDNSAGSTDKYQVTWKTQSRTSLDTKALKEKYPNIYAEFETRTQSRIMRVKEIK
jgi:predicted phage-related endonuclease